MPELSLHHLDQRSVAVEFPVSTETRVVRGHGRIVVGQQTGLAALHVTVAGPAEDFEFVFDIQQFSGMIEHGDRFACDYTIRLSDGCNPFFSGAAV
jgi:hypothetical protein